MWQEFLKVIKKKYDINLMKFISLFESITRTNVIDAFELEDIIYFVIQEGQIVKAVGKQGINYKKLENIIKKKIRMVENSRDINKFIQNVLHPIKLANIEVEPEKVTLTAPDIKSRGIIIGRGGANLKNLENIVKRYFDIKEIKIN